jgi:HAD superfamily hydrolase (TIGR01458 family)
MREALPVAGLLIDLDGVLFVDDTPIDGAIEAIDWLKLRGYRCRFLTNTSTLSRAALANKINRLGFDIQVEEIFSAPYAASLYLQSLTSKKCHYVISEAAMEEFVHIQQDDMPISHIVIGDIGDRWNYDLMNQVFSELMAGAELLAIHKNRFWQTGKNLVLDIGAFVTGLEYAARKPAKVIGKPSTQFLYMAMNDLGLSQRQVLVVGDDVDSDICGAKNAGMVSVLCKTGKYREDYFIRSDAVPDLVIDSISALPDLLEPIENM